ncbi:MAG: hypothetical protein ILN61_01560 [Lachnospiraceae bacterium]|nr:hypothetical protein [Lachnospiraceae bacterium]
MANVCDCCSKKIGILGGYSNKNCRICSRCYDIYTESGHKFSQKKTLEEIKEVVSKESATYEHKPFIIQILEIPISDIMKSPKKSIKWAVIFFVIAFLLTLLIIEEPIKYKRDGAMVKFYYAGEEREWVNTNKYRVYDIYKAEKDGQIITLTESYYEYTDNSGRVTKVERNGVSPLSSKDYCRIYREDGEWKLARNSDPKSLMLLSLFPVVLYSFSAILIKRVIKNKKKEKQSKDSDQKEDN